MRRRFDVPVVTTVRMEKKDHDLANDLGITFTDALVRGIRIIAEEQCRERPVISQGRAF